MSLRDEAIRVISGSWPNDDVLSGELLDALLDYLDPIVGKCDRDHHWDPASRFLGEAPRVLHSDDDSTCVSALVAALRGDDE